LASAGASEVATMKAVRELHNELHFCPECGVEQELVTSGPLAPAFAAEVCRLRVALDVDVVMAVFGCRRCVILSLCSWKAGEGVTVHARFG